MAASTFVVPIEGLTVTAPWQVGVVRISPQDQIAALDAARAASPPGSLRQDSFDHDAADMKCNAFAEVTEESIDAALDVIEDAVDVLRVYQQARALGLCAMFGLPGDTYRSKIIYAQAGERTGFGGRARGDALGWTFTDTALADFMASLAFQFVADAIGMATPPEGARRALLGIELLSQAIVTHRPALKLLGVVEALEAMLLRHEPGPKKLKLARYVSFFGCGSVEGDLCGRQRDTCPYLALDPNKDATKLGALRERSESDHWWLCSEWRQVVEWYELRNAAAHGEGRSVEAKDASTAEYWVLHYLLEPILDWLRLHSDEPVDALEQAVAALPEPPDWEALA